MKLDPAKVTVIHYPDPRLRVKCEPVRDFDDNLAALAARMIELMRTQAGVGLAAPQVGVPLRMFVMNHTGEDADTRVFVNPVITDRQGSAEAEEGCLSLPAVHVQVPRAVQCRIVAQDLKGNPIELAGQDLECRIWQHETDHLEGLLITDRMGPTDRIATKKTLQALVDNYKGGARAKASRR
jgi:peptide deformylase